MEKTRDESDHSRLRKFPKTAKKLQNYDLADFCQILKFFLSEMIDFYSFASFQAHCIEYPQGTL